MTSCFAEFHNTDDCAMAAIYLEVFRQGMANIDQGRCGLVSSLNMNVAMTNNFLQAVNKRSFAQTGGRQRDERDGFHRDQGIGFRRTI